MRTIARAAQKRASKKKGRRDPGAKCKQPMQNNKGSVTLTIALQFTLKSILGQKKNYGNSNISLSKKIIIFQEKNPLKRNQNPSRYYNSMANLKFQHKPI
jgi:hypothetical protein